MVRVKDISTKQSQPELAPQSEPLAGAFWWLSAFYLVYCARPEEWIPLIGYLPLAKISGIFALVGLVTSGGRAKRRLHDLPIEAKYLLGIVACLFASALLSPVWRGGAFLKTLDFSKVFVAWVLTFLVVTTFARLRRIIFIQVASVAAIALVSVLKGRSHPRLDGVIGGMYSNPNDLAFAVVLTLPFCFAFLLSTKSIPRKTAWAISMLVMCLCLFMTSSRAGFIDLLVTGAVCMWVFGIKGKRPHIIVAAVIVVLMIGMAAGGQLKSRFLAISGKNISNDVDLSAHDSYEERRFLMVQSVQAIAHYPWGLGLGNFAVYSGFWRDVHVSYLQIAAEGGIASLVLYLLYFGRGFKNLRRLRRSSTGDPEVALFAGALYATLIGFLVGAFFAPEAYHYFPYFAVSYTSVLLLMMQEREKSEGQSSSALSMSQAPRLQRQGAFRRRWVEIPADSSNQREPAAGKNVVKRELPQPTVPRGRKG